MISLMSKIDQLTAAATRLPDEKLDGIIAYVNSLADEPFYYSAPPEAIEAIERGRDDIKNGRTSPLSDVIARLRASFSLGA